MKVMLLTPRYFLPRLIPIPAGHYLDPWLQIVKPVQNNVLRLRVNHNMLQQYFVCGENRQQLGKIKKPTSTSNSNVPLFFYTFQAFSWLNELAWQLQSLRSSFIREIVVQIINPPFFTRRKL